MLAQTNILQCYNVRTRKIKETRSDEDEDEDDARIDGERAQPPVTVLSAAADRPHYE